MTFHIHSCKDALVQLTEKLTGLFDICINNNAGLILTEEKNGVLLPKIEDTVAGI